MGIIIIKARCIRNVWLCPSYLLWRCDSEGYMVKNAFHNNGKIDSLYSRRLLIVHSSQYHMYILLELCTSTHV